MIAFWDQFAQRVTLGIVTGIKIKGYLPAHETLPEATSLVKKFSLPLSLFLLLFFSGFLSLQHKTCLYLLRRGWVVPLRLQSP